MRGGADPAVPEPITSSPRVGPGRRALQMVYDVLIGLVWALTLPLFLLAGLVRPRFARKALSLSTVGLVRLPAPGERQRVLVHGVSVGEIKASQSLVHALRGRYEVVVSAFSDTGLQVARQLYPDLEIVRYPFDFAPIVARFWRRVRPDYVLLVELEAWPCFLRAANRRGAPVAVVSGRITEQSFRRYKLFGALPEFGRISLFAAQDEAYAGRFADLAGSSERVVVTGNVKVDGLRGAADPEKDVEVARLREEVGLGAAGRERPFVVVAGSTHEPEEVAFVRAARDAVPEARLIVVPRHPERGAGVQESLGELLGEAGAPERLSDLRAAGRPADPARPLIVDTIGELEALYGVADAVFIGGSLIPHGGQNMMEPAAQGVPVVYGPHVDNFLNETELLERAVAAVRVQDAAGLGATLARWARDPEARAQMGDAGRRALQAERGATGATLEALRARIGLA